MKYEDVKKEIKQRFSKAIDVISEGEEAWGKVFNTPIKAEFKGYPTDQLFILLQTWPEDKKTEIITRPWEELKNETNHNHNRRTNRTQT